MKADYKNWKVNYSTMINRIKLRYSVVSVWEDISFLLSVYVDNKVAEFECSSGSFDEEYIYNISIAMKNIFNCNLHDIIQNLKYEALKHVLKNKPIQNIEILTEQINFVYEQLNNDIVVKRLLQRQIGL